MRSLYGVVVSVLVVSTLLATSWTQTDAGGSQVPAPEKARDFALTDPVAIITPLPDEVSNGTWWYLDAQNSTYSGGTIEQYEWDVLVNGVHQRYYEPLKRYIFKQLGLYKINLTITTNDSKTATTFTAVYSILDSDSDLLPDWWEMYYFGNLSQRGSDDYDNDGYTNLQEVASNMNPTVKDPGKSLLSLMAQYWYYLVAVAAVVAFAIVVTYPSLKKRRKAEVKKKIEAALEIEKALEEEK